jgi:hypothetical protein
MDMVLDKTLRVASLKAVDLRERKRMKVWGD